MSQPFDASGKTLLELAPAEWVTFLGAPRPASAVRVISADLSTVTAMADQVIQVDDPDPWLLHVEFQAQRDPSLPGRMLAYAGALFVKHDLPVSSVAVLLSRAANGRNLTGILPVRPPVGRSWAFEYSLVRMWELPVDSFLNGSEYLLPLALLADIHRPDVVRTAQAVHDRVAALHDSALADKLLAIGGKFLLLRFGDMNVDELEPVLGIRGYWQNPNVQAYLQRELDRMFKAQIEERMKAASAAVRATAHLEGRQEGRADEARTMIHRLGTAKFGKPTKKVTGQLTGVSDIAELEDLGVRLLTANSWKELFAAPK